MREAASDQRGERAGRAIAEAWGGSYYLWQYALLSRLSPFLPADTVGLFGSAGRELAVHAEYHCRELLLVENDDHWRRTTDRDVANGRVADCSGNRYRVETLNTVEDRSLDLAVAFGDRSHSQSQSLVELLAALGRKLRSDGVAFVHHRSATVEASGFGPRRRFSAIFQRRRATSGATENHVSARRFGRLAEQVQLRCLSQELVAWRAERLTDCFSVVCRRDSRWAHENRLLRNHGFRRQIEHIRQLSMTPDTLPMDCQVAPDEMPTGFRYVKAA